MPYFQTQTDVDEWPFDFTGHFPSTDTIASTSVLCDPVGLVELTAKSSTSGLQRKVVVDAASATVDTEYKLGCQCTSAGGLRHTLYKTIRVLADETGATAITPSTGYNSYYTSILAQAGTAAPTATFSKNTLVGTTPVLSRVSAGHFRLTSTGSFPSGKTQVTAQVVKLLVGNESDADGQRISDDAVDFYVRDFADNLTDGFGILYLTVQTFT